MYTNHTKEKKTYLTPQGYQQNGQSSQISTRSLRSALHQYSSQFRFEMV